jgi:hypothetical protein
MIGSVFTVYAQNEDPFVGSITFSGHVCELALREHDSAVESSLKPITGAPDWYHETWIRSALSDNNPHRSYNDLKAFIACEGKGHLVREGPVGIGR